MKKQIARILVFFLVIPLLSVANIGTNLTHLGIYSRDSLIVDMNIKVMGQYLTSGGFLGSVTEFTDSVYAINDSLADVELSTLYTTLSSLTFISPTLSDSDTLVANNYNVPSGNFPNQIFLDGDSNSVFVFHVTGNLNFVQYSQIRTRNVRKSNILWVVSGDIEFKACSFPGIFVSSGNIKVTEGNYNWCSFLSMQKVKLLGLSSYATANSEEFMFDDYTFLGGGCSVLPILCDNILNGDFESNTAIPQATQNFFVCNWVNPSNNNAATPDHFNIASPPLGSQPAGFGSVSIPINTLGNQPTHSGTSYVGIFTWSPGTPNYREYIQEQLFQPLTAGRYFLSMFISSADNCNVTTDQIGAAITANQLQQIGWGPIATAPQVITIPNAPISACDNWLRHTGCFTATGGENFITIGNFSVDANTNLGAQNCPNLGVPYGGAYYYIEDVSLVRIPDPQNFTYTTSCTVPITIGPTLPLCVLSNPDFTYNWVSSSNLSNSTIVNPVFQTNIPGVYNYQLHLGVFGCADVIYNVQITVPGPVAGITGSLILPCDPNYTILTATPSGYSYVWTDLTTSTTSTGANLTVTHSGSYSLTISDGLCVSTATVTVVNPTISLSIDPAEQVICGDGTATITATCPSCTTFSWSPIISDKNQITVQPTDPISTYTVTGTDAYGCTATAISTIIVTQIPIITGTIAHCKDDDVILSIQNFDPTGSYTWNAPSAFGLVDISILGDKSKVQIYFNTEMGGVVTLDYDVGGCRGTVTYVVQNCCNPGGGDQYHIVMADGDTPRNLTMASSYSSNYIVINGNFIIDDDFSFINCHPIKLSPGAKIIVRPGKTLVIDDCDLRPNDGDACCRMWRGIELEEGAILKINKSTITQAEKAVLAYNKSIVQTSYTNFYSNYIGIDLESYGGLATVTLKMDNTNFYGAPYNCDGGPITGDYFAQPYDGQLTTIGKRPLAGIVANNINIVNCMGTSSAGDINYFNLANGIITNHVSQLLIRNSNFKDIIPDLTYYPIVGPPNGCALLLNNTRFNFTGLPSNVCLTNCNYGGYFFNGNGIVSDVISDVSVKEAFYISNSSRVSLHDNDISSTSFNIHTSNNRPNARIYIYNNKLSLPTTMTPPYQGNIVLTETVPNYIQIYDNPHINVNNGRFGINAWTRSNTIVLHNHIDITKSSTNDGIIFGGGINHKIMCNNIQAISGLSSNPGQSAITLSMTQKTEVGGNTTNNENVGLLINGSNVDATIKVNQFYNHNVGLVYQFTPITGAQLNLGNQWLGSYSLFGASTTSVSLLDLYANRFEYNLSAPTTNRPPSINIINWFYSNSMSDFQLSGYSCIPASFVPEEKDDKYYRIAMGQFDPLTEYPEQDYESQRYLYERLIDEPDLMQNSPMLATFYNDNLNTGVGTYSEVSTGILNAVVGSDQNSISFNRNMDFIEQKSDSLIIILESLRNDPQNPILIEIYDRISEDIKALTVSNDSINILDIESKRENLKRLLVQNRSLVVRNDNENNEKIVNDIFLRTIAIGNFNFTDEDRSSLESIVYQCPFSGGHAVYTARILYSQINPEFDYNDADLCGPHNSLRQGKSTSSLNVAIYPNPAGSFARLKYYLVEDQTATLRITDQMGKLMSQLKLDSKLNEELIDLSSFRSGIYTYQIIIDNAVVTSKLFSVIK